MFQVEGVLGRHERTKCSPGCFDLGDALISGLAIEAADTEEGPD